MIPKRQLFLELIELSEQIRIICDGSYNVGMEHGKRNPRLPAWREKTQLRCRASASSATMQEDRPF
jgi:hypothetical protein